MKRLFLVRTMRRQEDGARAYAFVEERGGAYVLRGYRYAGKASRAELYRDYSRVILSLLKPGEIAEVWTNDWTATEKQNRRRYERIEYRQKNGLKDSESLNVLCTRAFTNEKGSD
ncbi:hypothetical protein [Bhargavaea ginsengi]|uniref:hypothetical protein n=1 Tax=Bhargavaea ginsengi TaxID=426757 RepID=UPI003C7267A8